MPSSLAKPRYPAQRVIVPERVANALRPESNRQAIPARVTLDAQSVPFAGELREEQASQKVLTVVAGGAVVLATLRRPWNFVGLVVDPGSIGGPGLVWQLKILTRGPPGFTAPVGLAGTFVQAFTNLIVGARCELVVSNTAKSDVTGVRGAIWGMGER